MADCSVSIDLASAISTWMQGTKLDNYCIYGRSTVTLGRYAKLIAYLASFSILIDILGEQKVLEASTALSSIISRVHESIFNLRRSAFWFVLIGYVASNIVGFLVAPALEFWFPSLGRVWTSILAFYVFGIAAPFLVMPALRKMLNVLVSVLQNHTLCTRIRWSCFALLGVSVGADLFLSS